MIPDPRFLEVLIAAAETRRLTEAAKRLGISQPAVSLQLRALERQTSLPVFAFEGRRKVLTHFGRELYRIAKENQDCLSRSYETLERSYANAETLTLRLGGRKETLEAVIPRIEFPGTVEFISMSSPEAVQQLLDHRIDLAISYDRVLPDSAEIVARKIFGSASNFVIHKKFLGKRRLKDLIDNADFLAKTPCVTYRGGGVSLREWAEHLELPFSKLKVRAIAEDWRIVLSLVERGWGYSIVPGHIEKASSEVALCPIPASVLKPYTFYVLFHRHLREIRAFQRVLEKISV